MQAFSNLTQRGRALRLRRMALAALDRYSVEPRQVSLVANHLNAIFRVTTQDAATFVLRISHPTWRRLTDLRSELMWLEALHRDTDIGAPVPFPAHDGALFTTISVDGVPEPRHCVLLSWIPGPLLAERLSEANLQKLGILAASLHEHAAGFVPPAGFTTREMSSVYARAEPDLLFTDAYRDVFTPESRVVFERVADRVRQAFAVRYADPCGRRVIHNDLHHENVKVFHARLHPLDFEDTLWGYPVQDIAMTFFDLLDYTDPAQADYARLRTAFERGYTACAPWPEAYSGEIDTFIAGRQLWRANYVAWNERPYARGFTTRMAARFQTFLDHGRFPR